MELFGTPTAILEVICQPSEGDSPLDPKQQAQAGEELAIADEAQGWPSNPVSASVLAASLMSVAARSSNDAEYLDALTNMTLAQWTEFIGGILKGDSTFEDLRAFLPGADLASTEQLAFIIRQLPESGKATAISGLNELKKTEQNPSIDAVRMLLT